MGQPYFETYVTFELFGIFNAVFTVVLKRISAIILYICLYLLRGLFKLTGRSPNDVLVQAMEKLTYDKNSSSTFKIIKRHETELKWIQLLQTHFPLGFNDNIYHDGNCSKMPDFDVFSLLEIRKRKSRSHGSRKKGNDKGKNRAVKRSNTLRKDFFKKIDDHGRHAMLSFFKFSTHFSIKCFRY